MRVVVAAGSLSASLDAAAAGVSAAAGWSQRRPHDETTTVVLSGGSNGLLDALEASIAGCERVAVEVANARGYAAGASWLRLPDGTAVIEGAVACGLRGLPATQHNPRLTTTYGVGQLVAAAAEAGVPAVVLGLGGSAATDGGAGFATALGHRLLRTDGNRVKVGGEFLVQLDRVDPRPPLGVPITALFDRDIPLLGPSGAPADVPDQGGQPQDVALLEANLQRLADVAERDLSGGPWREMPGAGAGGGLGFGAAAFAGATLRDGAQWFCEVTRTDEKLAEADMVVLVASSGSALPRQIKHLAELTQTRVLLLDAADATTAEEITAAAAALAAELSADAPPGWARPGPD